MYKVGVYNEYHIRNLLLKDDIDFDKFYKDQLIQFLNISRKDTEKYKELYRDKNKTIDKARNRLIEIQNKYGYILDDVIFTLRSDNE